MATQEIAAFLSAFIPAISYGPFLKDVLQGTVKPHRISWLMWSIVYTVLIIEQISAGAKGAVWLTASTTIISYLVYFLSLRSGIGSFNRISFLIICAVIAMLSLVIHIENPLTSILLLISINATAFLFTVIKTFKHPWSENLSFWAAHMFGSFFSFLALGENATIAALAYPTYGLVATGIIVVIMIYKRNMRLSSVKIQPPARHKI